MRSQVLGGQMLVFARDRSVPLNPAWADYPVFTLEELLALVMTDPTPETLRAVVITKQEMPAARVVGDIGPFPVGAVQHGRVPTPAAQTDLFSKKKKGETNE